jgi:hypothetical protein
LKFKNNHKGVGAPMFINCSKIIALKRETSREYADNNTF